MNAWTIMVYMSADSNLNLEMAYALEEIKKVTDANEGLNVYVYYDGASPNVPTMYCKFSDASSSNFYRSDQISGKLIPGKQTFDENSAEENSVINFVHWCVNQDPEEGRNERRYAFIFSGHSFGFLNWGLFKDESADYSMTFHKLKYLFERITWDEEKLKEDARRDSDDHFRSTGRPWSKEYWESKTKTIIGKKLDILGFDSCLMSTIEIASQFKDVALTMVASEGNIPKAGWNYAGILARTLGAGSGVATKQAAVAFVDEFIKQQNKFALADISVDMAAWDLAALDNVEKRFGEMVIALDACLKYPGTTKNQVRRLIGQAHSQCQTFLFEQHVDLGDFCQVLSDEIEMVVNEITVGSSAPLLRLKDACFRLNNSIDHCILLTGFSGSDYQFATGISLFFPWSLSSYRSAQRDYRQLCFIRDLPSGRVWDEFLTRLLETVTYRSSAPVTIGSGTDNILSSPVVYESYTGITSTLKAPPDGTKAPPDGTKAPPDGTKAPPDGTKAPPDGTKMSGLLELFMARFKALKNFQSNWNRSGFRSKTVVFRRSPTGLPSPEKPGEIVVLLPLPRTIQKTLDEVLERLGKIEEKLPETGETLPFSALLKLLISEVSDTQIVRILETFADDDLFSGRKHDLGVEWAEHLGLVFEDAISSVLDSNLQAAFLAKLKALSEK